MRPGDHHEERLPHAARRGLHPEGEEDPRVGVGGIEQLVRDPRAGHVAHEQHRDGEAEGELDGLPQRHAEVPPLVERVQTQAGVDEQRPIEHGGGSRVAPELHKPPAAGLHRVERDQAQGVIEEMGREVGEEHQPRGKPELAGGERRHAPPGNASGTTRASRSHHAGDEPEAACTARCCSTVLTSAGRFERSTSSRAYPTTPEPDAAELFLRPITPTPRSHRRRSFLDPVVLGRPSGAPMRRRALAPLSWYARPLGRCARDRQPPSRGAFSHGRQVSHGHLGPRGAL
jgi:hypothetical protein